MLDIAQAVQRDRCPLRDDDVVYWGPGNLLWSTVDEVLFGQEVAGGWVVLVRYTSGTHELLRYHCGDGSVSRDRVEHVETGQGHLGACYGDPLLIERGSASERDLCIVMEDTWTNERGKEVRGTPYRLYYTDILDLRAKVGFRAEALAHTHLDNE